MVCTRYITTLLASTLVLADYYIDNANTSVEYSMPATGQGWGTFSTSTQQLALDITNSTGNYSIILDASNCYDQNYALGVCGTSEGCFVQMPFVGSGITMYVFSAGLTGMSAGFSIDGGTAVSNSIDAPPVASNYQISNVSMYNIQGLPTGLHTMKMTLLDWSGGRTSMKFDYAHVNETFVASPVTTTSLLSATASATISATTSATISASSSTSPSPASAQSSASSKKNNVGAIVGGTVGGLVILGLVIGFLCLRRRRSTRQTAKAVVPPDSTFQVNPFMSEFSSPTLPPASQASRLPFGERTDPHTRSAILRDALAAGNYTSLSPDESSQSISSGPRSTVFQPLRRQLSSDGDDKQPRSSVDASAPLSDLSRYNLRSEQVEVIDRLRAGNVPLETIARVIEGFVTANLSEGEANNRVLSRADSFVSHGMPPPSYQTQGG